ncbi:AAA family ATPase [Streptomyces sp. NPDC050504]|uniref:AAA family ATPase n=1 Tax=Streptomyces sp. NPDC050504 TaxID=3365618 RepID=UPI003798B1B8
MRLHRLGVTAFGPFGAEQEVDFDALSSAGLFLLHGPTGAGKTSVLDAVCFALYGAVPGARQSPGTTLRSDHAQPGTSTEVVLDLTVGGRRLEITRRPAQLRKKKRGDGFTTEKAQSWLREYDAEAAEWRALSRSHQEIGEEINQLMGMSREQFCQVVLLPQGDFARFLRSDADARGKLLGRLFDTRRFAAVEERLAELRRAAEQEVRAGDERLIAVAQRIAQAGGPAAAEQPFPDVQPGSPGLAGAVLEWAAVARAGARERRDIARCAVTAAEQRQARAARALEEERELAALQQRYADARRRADELEERRPEWEALTERLERARRADRVAPALALREAADRDHTAARDARGRTRVLLHESLADAGTEQLAALERKLREELGGLAAARRAERRSAEIGAELATLERQGRADDDLLREAEGWFAGWEATRAALQERADAARDAATTAETLAGRLGPARRRLDAAHRRDALADRTGSAERRLTAARERANGAHESWLDLKERRLRGIAAELATGLVAGEPCAVCGSAEHPRPARAGAGHVDRAAEEEAFEAHQRADAARADAERALGAVREDYAAARELALATEPGAEGGPGAASAEGDPEPASSGPGAQGGSQQGARSVGAGGEPTVAELSELVARLEREHGEARRLAAGTNAAREALSRAEAEHDQRLAAHRQAERRTAARTERREVLERERAGLEEGLAEVRAGGRSVADHAALLEHRVALLTDAADAVRGEQEAARRLKEADDRLADAAFKAGFDTPAQAAATLLGDPEQRDLQHRIDLWQAEAAAVADRLDDPDAQEAARQPAAEPRAAHAVLEEAESALRAGGTALAAARERCAELDGLTRRALRETDGLGPLRAEYDRVARLAGLTAGTSAENERKMRLEYYVLAARLEQVAAAATARLQQMSSGRYTLVHSDARSGGRRSGLGLHVVDAWTGSERDTATLSGGETFFASLALALGLADVVTEEAGGVRLDTLFIDEGFGSLDDQTLDDVLDVLDSLRERDRSVGIVSHVADLRRRIPVQLEVVKERDGSAVRHRTSGTGD